MSIKDQVKNIAREVISGTAISPAKYRIGTVSDLTNPDGSNTQGGVVYVMVDGQALQCSPAYPVVKGQEVVVVRDPNNGSYSCIPTKPAPTLPPLIHPPFFSGGFIRCQFGQYFQDAGGSGLYQILAPDLPGYDSMGGCLSPDGTRACVIWKNQNFGATPGNTPDVHYRVYQIGQGLSGKKVVNPNPPILDPLFTMNPKLLFEVVRNQYNLITAPPAVPYNVGLCPQVGLTLSNVCALTDDDTKLYFAECAFILQIQGPTVNGTMSVVTNLWQYDNTQIPKPPNPLTNTGQWQAWFAANLVGGNAGTPRSVFNMGASDNVGGPGQIILSTPSIIDCLNVEMMAVATEPIGNQSLNDADSTGVVMPDSPSRLYMVQPSSNSIAAGPWGPSSNHGTTYPAVSVPLGPKNTLIAQAQYANIFGQSGQTVTPSVLQKNFASVVYQSQYPSVEDFLRVMWKDAKGNYVQGKFTNSISGDPFQSFGHSSLVPANFTAFIIRNQYLTDKNNLPSNNPVKVGWYIDAEGHIRPVTTMDGQKFTIETDKTKFVLATSGKPDTSILRIFTDTSSGGRTLSVVSTLP